MTTTNNFIRLSIPTFFVGQEFDNRLEKMVEHNIGTDNPAYQTICTDWVTAEVLDYIRTEGNVEDWSSLYIIDCEGLSLEEITDAFHAQFEYTDFNSFEFETEEYHGFDKESVIRCYITSDAGDGFWVVFRNNNGLLAE